MKNLIKITTMWLLLIVAGLLIGGCGGGAENFVQGNGKITVTVKDSGGALLANVKIEVLNGPVTDLARKVVDTGVTDATGTHDFQETVGSDYYFKFTDLTTPARFVSPVDYPTKVTPQLTSTQNVNVTLL